ncbi:MAG: TetR/AcrR family transcriptional regulator [Blastocatellia bacterium]|nr:TetR/AcrR family transcriptional regulator [Blastocatellia bacterium]
MKVAKGKSRKAGKEYHHGDLRRALVDAAAALAAEKGIADVSLREAARTAGVSHAAPYHHFKDKAALLAAVAEEGFIRLDAFQNEALESASRGPSARLSALGKAYVDFAIRNPHYFRVMFRKDLVETALYPSLQEVAGRTFDRLLTVVGDCLGSSSDTEAMPLALTAWSLVHGLASLWLDGPLSSREFGGKNIGALSDEVIGEFEKIVNTRR